MLACDVPNPDWPQPGGLTDKEVKSARRAADRRMVKLWNQLLQAAHEMRLEWAHSAAPALHAHEQQEAYRGLASE